jgi:hypothetical protein
MKHITRTILLTILLMMPNCASFTLFEDLTGPVCWDWIPIEFEDRTLCVSPDYYSVDGVRTPVGMTEALEIADRERAFLPTPAMVDAIWDRADIQLEPITMTPGPQMTSDDYYHRHNAMIEEQLQGVDTDGLLIAGHKKDIVQNQQSNRVTIYGWHRSSGDPIQPVYSGHGWDYRDYSHGLRLVRWAD